LEDLKGGGKMAKRSLTNAKPWISLIDKVTPEARSSKFDRGVQALKNLVYDGKVQKIVTELEKDI
jgi:hypothetical protein